jgi:glutathione peroxidase-family protein
MRFLLLSALSAAAVAGLAATEPARPAPPFTVFRAGNPAPPPLQLSQFRGKVVVLVFIDTNCTHCQDLTANVLIPVARDYARRGVEVVECAFNDQARQEVPGFIGRFQAPFPVGWNTRAAVMSFLEISVLDQRPIYVPHMVFVDRAGTIRGDYRGESAFFNNANGNIRAELDRLLSAGSAKK